MMPKHKRITPCDTCRMFDQLQHPFLFCRACIGSGRYADEQRKIDDYERCRSANA